MSLLRDMLKMERLSLNKSLLNKENRTSEVMAIILNYNSSDESIKCAEYLLKQEKSILITIVDNCSTDASIKKLKLFSQKKDVILLENKENNGFSAGNNIGLKKASEYGCKYALIINPDVEIRDIHYVEACLNKMKEDSNIAVLGTDIINMKSQHQNPMREVSFWEEVLWPLVMVRNKLTKKILYVGDYKKSGYCEKLAGCCFFLRMDAVRKMKYLDENVFMYSEEPILASRVAAIGLKEYYMHELTAYHNHRASEKGNINNRWESFFKSRIYYIKKYKKYNRFCEAIVIQSLKLQKKIVMRKDR